MHKILIWEDKIERAQQQQQKHCEAKVLNRKWSLSLSLRVFEFMCVHSNAMKCEEFYFNLNDVWMMKWTIWFGIWIHLSQHWTATLPYGVRLIFHRLFFPSFSFRLNSHQTLAQTHKRKKATPVCYLFDNKWRKTNRKKVDLSHFGLAIFYCGKMVDISKKWPTKTTSTTKRYFI